MNEQLNNQMMQEAIEEAKKAALMEEVPIGAVAVVDGKIVARAHNIRERTQNPLGHAEIILLEELARNQNSWRLTDATVYVTCEPCLMCAGALLQARVPRLVYGCKNKESGACGSVFDVLNHERMSKQIEITGGVLEKECVGLLSDFFRLKRG